MDNLKISVSKIKRSQRIIFTIKLNGSIDIISSPKVKFEIEKLVKSSNYNIVIDFEDVDYINSLGWGVFINYIKIIREHGGDLKLSNMANDIYYGFETLEFHLIFRHYMTIQEAINDF